MTEQAATKQELVVQVVAGCLPEIGRSLWMLEDARQRTQQTLKSIQINTIDWSAEEGGHTIGTLLYHIAAIEADYAIEDVLQSPWPPEISSLFPVDVRDTQGRLSIVRGETVAQHWARLEKVRAYLLSVFKDMTIQDFRRPRQMPHYRITPEWTLHHLCQHEAEHRSEIAVLRAQAEKQQN